MTKISNLKNAAIRGAAIYGLHIFRLTPGTKIPIRGTNGVDDATNDDRVIEHWWNENPNMNIGLACGASGLVALDFDPHCPKGYKGGDLLDRLRTEHPTVEQETQSGGYHLLYRQPDGFELGNSRGSLPSGVDVRGRGGYVLLSPSILDPDLQGLDIKDPAERAAKQNLYRTGHGYRWVDGCSPAEIDFAPLPDFVIELIQTKKHTHTQSLPIAPRGEVNASRYALAALNGEVNAVRTATNGSRNETLNRSAFALGGLVGAGVLDAATVEGELIGAALAIGLPPREAVATVASGLAAGVAKPRSASRIADVARKNYDLAHEHDDIFDESEAGGDTDGSGEGKPKKPKQADILFALVSNIAELFTAQDGDRYARVPIDTHFETYALTSKSMREFMDGLYYEHHKTIPGAQAKQDSIGLLSYHARSEKRTVFYRSAFHEGKIYLDLGTPKWNAIEIDTDGWRIVESYPVIFRRSSATKPLITPIDHDDLRLILNHINIKPDDWFLFSAWLVAAMIPNRPTPILTFPNEQGTGKTTNTNRIKSLIDPGKARVMPNETRDLMVMAENNWVAAFDNVSSVPADVADALCQIVTGGEYAKRQNYSDRDEAVMQVQRPIIMNGIGNITSDRADLLQRSLMIRPPVIPDEKRVDEKTSDARFEIDQPKIFGALLNALATVLQRLDNVVLPTMPRMADFARIGYALHGQPFIDSYMANIQNATSNAADSVPLVDFIVRIADFAIKTPTQRWEGTATRLLETINEMDGADKYQKSRDWPKSNRTIKNIMQRIAPLVRASGVDVAQTDTKMGSWFVIEKTKLVI